MGLVCGCGGRLMFACVVFVLRELDVMCVDVDWFSCIDISVRCANV